LVVIGVMFYTKNDEKIRENLAKLTGEYGFINRMKGYTTDFNQAPESMVDEPEQSQIVLEEADYDDSFDPRD